MAKAAATEEGRLALTKAENDFKLQMGAMTNGRIKDANDLEEHLARIAADDRADARDREVKVGDKTTRNLAYILYKRSADKPQVRAC